MPKLTDEEKITLALTRRYPGNSGPELEVRNFSKEIYCRYIKLGLAEPTFIQRICSTDEFDYSQQSSEVLFANELWNVGVDLTPSKNAPDLLFNHKGQKIWVEVICPEATGLPLEWTQGALGTVFDFPHREILLRWTNAISAKATKLIGSETTQGYLQKNVVGPKDIYVIAINSRLLKGRGSAFTGISQFPAAAEAVFPFGPLQVQINTSTFQVTKTQHQHRPHIPKLSGAFVPTNTFLDPRFSPISAIWAAEFDEAGIVGSYRDLAVIHNPLAKNPIPLCVLPAYSEYVANDDGANSYILENKPGRLTDELTTR
jgi:hypothetical protein